MDKMKILSFLGGCYAAFAIVTFMAACKASTSSPVNQPEVVAQAGAKTLVGSERLFDAKGASQYYISVYSIPNCHWCVKQKAELESLQKMGYNTRVVQKRPLGVGSFPYTIITYGSYEGDIVYAITGYRSAYVLDLLLSSNPKALNPRNDVFLTVWLKRNDPKSDRMRLEVPKLEALGYQVVVRTPPATRFAKAFPIIVVSQGRLNGPRVREIHGLRTAEQIDEILFPKDRG